MEATNPSDAGTRLCMNALQQEVAVIILVSGATGFVGGAITRHLLAAGYTVRGLTRSASKAYERFQAYDEGRAALTDGRLEFVEGDVTSPATLLAAVDGVDAVIQSAQFTGAPVENPARGLTYMEVDRNGTLNLLGAIARAYGKPSAGPAMARFGKETPRFLYMSGISVSEEARTTWDRAKWQAEQAIKGSGLNWTIVRSSWAYGPHDTALNRILGYSNYLPFVPIFGDGNGPLTPVHVEDVGRLFAGLLARPEETTDCTFGLGGPETVTLNQFLQLALDIMGRRRPILHIPKTIGKVQSGLMQYLPGRPLSPDAVDFVSQAGAATEADRGFLAERVPDFQTTPLRKGLAYLAS
jgi:nucleoside-diphosphate-sugar epimerase